jgi:hypothetical protein
MRRTEGSYESPAPTRVSVKKEKQVSRTFLGNAAIWGFLVVFCAWPPINAHGAYLRVLVGVRILVVGGASMNFHFWV